MMRQRLVLGRGASSALRNGTRLLGSYWIEAVLRLVYAVAIARILGAEQFGVWSYILALYTFLIGITGFGIELQIPLRLGRSRRQVAATVQTFFAARVVLLALAVAVLLLMAFATEPGITRTGILISAMALIGRGLSLFARSAFVGLERAEIVFKVTAIFRVLEVLAGLGLLILGLDILVLITVHSLAWLCEGLVSVWLLQTHIQFLSARFDRRLIPIIVRRGLPLGAAAAFRQWLTSGPILLLKLFGGDLAIVGKFALAQQIAIVAVTSARAFYSAALPILSRAARRQDSTAKAFGFTTALVSAGFFGTAAIIAFWIGPAIATMLFGPEFRLVGELFAPFMIVGGLMLAPVGYIQKSAARAVFWPDSLSTFVGALLLAVTMPWLTAVWGVWGAMAATLLAWLAVAVLAIVLSRRID